MNHNWTPDNDDMARLIATSFDALPGPDEERLEAVRARLETQLKRPRHHVHGKGWLWLFLLLGGAVSAAWWLNGILISNEVEQPSIDTSTSRSNNSADAIYEGADSQQASGSDDTERIHGYQEDSPIIYQREQ